MNLLAQRVVRCDHKSIQTFLPICSVIIFGVLGFAGPSSGMSTSQMEEILLHRHEQFDNALLTYSSIGMFEVDAADVHLANAALDLGIDSSSIQNERIPVMYHETLTVRGHEATFTRKLDASLASQATEPGSAQPLDYQKWSNTDGLQREITRHYKYEKGPKEPEYILEILPKDPQGDSSERYRMEAELALGFGLGKRIQEIETVQRLDDGHYRIQGSFQIPSAVNEADFEANLDERYIVRSVTLNVQGSSVVDILKFRSEDIANQDKFPVAKVGTYERIRYKIEDGKRKGTPKTISEKKFVFDEVQFDLSDSTYSRLVDMSVPDGAYVMDRIADIRYRKGRKDSPAATNP